MKLSKDGKALMSLINHMRILEMTVNGRRLGCKGHIASSGGHRYLFVSFHVVTEAA